MNRLVLPQRLASRLGEDARLESAVKRAVAAFEPWLGDETTGLTFFPEFTEHGCDHVNRVMRAADALVPDSVWELFTSRDAGALIISCVLHDAAMHLTEESFLALLSAPPSRIISGLSDEPWTAVWKSFFDEAKRWDGRKLLSIFGASKGEEPTEEDFSKYVVSPTEMGDPEKWPKAYKRFIGEFIRRFHARIAHEIAVFGVPGPGKNENWIRVADLDDDLADLSGLIARSHNIPLRDTFDYLHRKFDGRVVCRNTHPVFLMVLLRIADFFEIQADRAPADVLKVRSLRSPLSRREWSIHHAIVEVRPDEFDREAIFVVAKPQDAATYLRTKKLLTDIQSEIDVSWAVLGEVYSKQADLRLDRLGIRLRRVRSNLDDTKRFIQSSSPSYVPIHAAFEAADADLLKLLVEPLYGHNPPVGVREMLQNAVDAVLELDEHCKRTGLDKQQLQLEALAADAEVEISLCHNRRKSKGGLIEAPNKWKRWIQITDRGIGMDETIIKDYFLRAGASFRKSEAWHRMFGSEDNEGNDGTPRKQGRVFRSGRFGVGVLAAFLLGPEIQVITRRIGQSRGLQFVATIDTDNVELSYVDCPIGTTVRVRVGDDYPLDYKEDYPGYADWDWFCLDYPKVVRRGPSGNHLEQMYVLPRPHSILPSDFRRIKVDGYDDIHWTYEDAPRLICNGIVINRESLYGFSDLSHDYAYGRHSGELVGTFRLELPNVSIFDSAGVLPLNLQRTELTTDDYPFKAELLDDLARDFIAFCLVDAPDKPLQSADSTPRYYKSAYPTLRPDQDSADPGFLPLASTLNGVLLADPALLHARGISSVLLLPNECSVAGIDGFWRHALGATVPVTDGGYWNRRRNLVALSLGDASYLRHSPFSRFTIKGGRALLPRDRALEINRPRGLKKEVRKGLSVEWEDRNWILLKKGVCPEPSFDCAKLNGHAPRGYWDAIVAELYFETTEPDEPSRVGKAWLEIIGKKEIPFAKPDRRKQLDFAFGELSDYVERWQAYFAKPREGKSE